MLEDDLQLLKGLFHADGEGLPRLKIDELCWPLTGILVTMQLDTGILISNYKQACLPTRLAISPVSSSESLSSQRWLFFSARNSCSALDLDSRMIEMQLGNRYIAKECCT